MSTRRLLLLVLALTGLALPAEAQRIYWWARDDSEVVEGIFRCNLDGSNVELVIPGADRGFALDLVAGKMYWSDAGLIVRSNLDGTDVQTVIHYPNPSLEMALDLLHDKLYWRDNDGVFWTKLDGSDARNVLYDAVFCICGFAVDPPANKMYWVITGGQTVNYLMRGDLEGHNSEQLITEGLGAPKAVALDSVAEKVYFLDGEIYRANLDGTDKELVLGQPDITSVARLAVDAVGRKLYWTDSRDPAIHRAELDGTNPEYALDVEFRYEASSLAIDPRVPGDCDFDLIVRGQEIADLLTCARGPDEAMELGCACADADGDGRIDLLDCAALQNNVSAP